MSSNTSQIFRKKLELEKEIDSSELSSDSETNDALDESKENSKSTQTEPIEKLLTDEFISDKRIIIDKRPRFFSECKENFKFNKEFRSPKLKNVTKTLKKFAEDEMIDLNKRKFSFV